MEIDDTEYGDYLFELFAELAAAIRAYNIDGNMNYIDMRIKEIQAKTGNSSKPYKKALIGLEQYKNNILKYRDYKNLSVKEQVASMFSDEDLKVRMSRKNYNSYN